MVWHASYAKHVNIAGFILLLYGNKLINIPTLMLFVLTACALPDTKVKTGSVRPSLSIQGAPPNAVLYLDGLVVGKRRSIQRHKDFSD